jgi:Ca2+/Na+ antiporter
MYVVYALVASYFNTSIVPMMCPMNAAQNPVSQNEADTYVQITDESKPRSSSQARGRGSSYSEAARKSSRALSAMLPNTAAALDHQRAVGDAINDVERSGQALECYLYKKNRLYAKMQLSSLKWMLRWCTIDDNEFTTCKNRDTKEGLIHMDIYTARSVDIYKVEQHQFRITTGDGEEFFFRAQSAESMHECMEKIKALIAKYSQLSMPERQDLLAKAGNSAYGEEHEEHEGLIDWPKNPTAMAVSLHLFLFPLKFLFYYTIPDMHVNPKGYWGAIFSCVVWMALLSYGMAVMCNFIGGWLQIPQLIIGLTLGAIGTSFPNVFASILVAQQGQGNMAVCAAFGANLFNIFIGLGLPWLTYAIVFGDYAVMAFKGVRAPAILLIAFVVVFMLYMMATNFVMTKNAGYVMVVVYIAYLVLAVLNVWKDY